jgi:hypothetical protein
MDYKYNITLLLTFIVWIIILIISSNNLYACSSELECLQDIDEKLYNQNTFINVSPSEPISLVSSSQFDNISVAIGESYIVYFLSSGLIIFGIFLIFGTNLFKR